VLVHSHRFPVLRATVCHLDQQVFRAPSLFSLLDRLQSRHAIYPNVEFSWETVTALLPMLTSFPLFMLHIVELDLHHLGYCHLVKRARAAPAHTIWTTLLTDLFDRGADREMMRSVVAVDVAVASGTFSVTDRW